jgi:hypothetical protein
MGAADLTNPQSLNQYAYVMNTPVNLTDPDGMDPWDEGGGFGGGCDWCLGGSTGIPSIPGWSGSPLPGSSQGLDPASLGINNWHDDPNGNPVGDYYGDTYCSLFSMGRNCLSLNYWWGGYRGHNWWPTKGPEIPKTPDIVCGGGYFVLGGKGGEIPGVAHGGAYVMTTHDSRSGTSVGYLLEAGTGPVSYGREKSANTSSGKVDSSNLFLFGVGDHLGGFIGDSGSGQVGVFGSIFGLGAGAYANLAPNTKEGTCRHP